MWCAVPNAMSPWRQSARGAAGTASSGAITSRYGRTPYVSRILTQRGMAMSELPSDVEQGDVITGNVEKFFAEFENGDLWDRYTEMLGVATEILAHYKGEEANTRVCNPEILEEEEPEAS
jgi:hypothetical protein